MQDLSVLLLRQMYDFPSGSCDGTCCWTCTLRCSDPDVEHALRCLEPEVHMRTVEQHCCVPSIEVGSVRRCIDWDVWHRNIQPIARGVHQCTHWCVHHPSKLEVYTATLIEDPTTHRRWSMVIDGEISNTDTCSCNSTSSKGNKVVGEVNSTSCRSSTRSTGHVLISKYSFKRTTWWN